MRQPVAALLLLLAAPLCQAATPSSGTVSSTAPSATWAGGIAAPIGAAGCAGPTDPLCDNYKLTVAPPSYDFVVHVVLDVTATDDWDLRVYDSAGTVIGTSGNSPGQDEIVVLVNPAAGTYTVQAVNFAAAVPVSGSATLKKLEDASPDPSSEVPTWSIHSDPGEHGAAEPSLGVNWNSEIADNGGTVMYIAGLNTLRVRFDDCTSPPRLRESGNWLDVSPANAVTSLDPILLTDPVTGRTFSSQLLGKTSLMSFTDDDGDSWVPSQGSGINSGVDHQTVGGGPLPPGLPMVGLTYPHAVYYCSQDLVVAECAMSVDGGLTFGPALPIYNSMACGGLHGHIKVAPDGTVYVPNKGCNTLQAVVVSTNGLTWDVRTVPGSVAGVWDPSVAVGSAGTLYFAFANGDGRAMAAVSLDKGKTWSQPVDLGAAFGIRDTAFPTAIAGDDDRAAVAFLGTTTPNSSGDDPNSPAVWHLYIATTYDRGATWTTVNATPGDPVQRGTICSGGTLGCGNGSRNLLDFNDIQVDRRGRPVAAFADGCTGPCVDSPINTQGALAAMARLKGGKGLFSAFDQPPGPPAEPLAQAEFQGDSVHISWLEPADGGRPIKKYRIYRVQTGQPEKLIGNVSATTFSFVDRGFSPAKNPRYEVRAVNVYGESAAKAGCDNRLPPVGPPPPVNQCAEPGAIVVSDPKGDATDQLAAHDIEQISVAEPADPGPGKVTFLLKMASLATVPPSTTWPINFKGSDGNDYWVAMKTSVTGAISFGYGTGTNASVAGTPADPASGFSADGTIRIVVPRSAFGNPAPGGTISGFLTRVRVELGPTGSALTPDNAPDGLAGNGSYRIVGNENCASQ